MNKPEAGGANVVSLGVFLSPTLYTSPPSTAPTITTTPVYVETNTVILNSYSGWKQVKFCFIASGGELFLAIGPTTVSTGHPPNVPGPPATTCSFVPAISPDAYTFVDDVSLTAFSPSITGPSTVCPYSTAFFSVSSCSANCGSLTYNWDFGDGNTVANGGLYQGNNYTTPGTYTIHVAAVFGSYSLSIPYVVTVLMPPSGTITASAPNSCSQGIESFTVTPSPSGSYTYAWSASSGTITSGQGTNVVNINFAGVSTSATISAVITNSAGCSSTINYVLAKCCTLLAGVTVYPSNYTFSTTATYTTGQHVFTGTVSIAPTATVSFYGAEIIMNPNARFRVGSGSYLDIERSYMHGCTSMWDGIYTYTNSSLHIESNIIEDAKRVVVDSLGSYYLFVLSNIFNKNFEDIVLKTAVTSNSLHLEQNVFTSSNLHLSTSISYTTPINMPTGMVAPSIYTVLPKANLISPYATQSASLGILCSGTQSTSSAYLRIGNPTATPTVGNQYQNLFDKLQYGVYSDNSKIQVSNCNFQYHTNGASAAGVYVLGSTLTTGNITDVKVGTSTSEKCYFDNNDVGVYNYNPSPLVVQGCVFTNNDIGAAGLFNSKGKTVSIIGNTMTDNRLGVLMASNTNVNCSIQTNNITNTSVHGTYANNYGIYTSEISTPTLALYNITGNTVGGIYNGIFTTGTYSAYVYNNAITMRADNTASTNVQYGIQAVSCNIPKITANAVGITSGSVANTWQRGIGTDVCTLPSVTCNSVTSVAVHIKAYGLNWTSTGGNGYVGNIMNTYNFGFWLDGNGEVGDQFFLSTTKKSADNQWSNGITGSFRTIATANSNTTTTPSGNRFFTRSTPSQYSIPTAEASPTIGCNPFTGCPFLGTNTVNVSSVCGGGGGGSMIVIGGGGSGELMQNADQIAQSNSASPNSFEYMSQRQLYQNLMLQDVNTSASLNSFKQTMSTKSIGKFFKADSLFNQGITDNNPALYTSAAQLSTSINGILSIEQNQNSFNAIYAYYLSHDHTFSRGQINSLEQIAMLCPMMDGPAVYQARALLFRYTGKKYINDCENGVPSSVTPASRFASPTSPTITSDEEKAISNSIKVYPNPSSNDLFVETGDFTGCQLIMYNVMGQLVIDQILESKTRLDVHTLSNGAYIYNINSARKPLKTGKLIINR
ncbi:MAG: T9SS type A sorting domain-containing protein [Bacteroidia bacterium]